MTGRSGSEVGSGKVSLSVKRAGLRLFAAWWTNGSCAQEAASEFEAAGRPNPACPAHL